MNRGFVIMAENTDAVEYVKCASVLAASIRRVMPEESITLVTTDTVESSYLFDSIVTLPYGDTSQSADWKLSNDWQVYSASPYDYTIKLEADMYVPMKIDHWWDILQHRDIVVSTTIRDRKNAISDQRYYRRIIDDNLLPDTYNAITYFKKSPQAEYFYSLVRDIFENWSQYRNWIQCDESEPATTDVVYAIAASIVGREHCTLPAFTDMSMIHMKPAINYGKLDDWTKEYLYEINHDSIRIETVPQQYPFHYHVKDFAATIERELNGI